MSNSRLEKFIYAICSMDVSDLPAPLSRIEILWNCLITGETPDFESQSRNEQYLMAMLGLYELENLPTPMSRGEKLLYKIAVGETDLSDVPGYLSRYEELLKYLIENGGIGDFEYVLYTINQSLYTLYTTAEKPVKSAILKGKTLVNLFDFKEPITVMTDRVRLFSSDNFKNNLLNGTYTIINTSNKKIALDISDKSTDVWKKTVTLLSGQKTSVVFDNTYIKMASFSFSDGWSKDNLEEIKRSLVVLNGEHTDIDIPYFEGMQSVKMPVLTTTGNNLYSYGDISKTSNNVVHIWKTDILVKNGQTLTYSGNGFTDTTDKRLQLSISSDKNQSTIGEIKNKLKDVSLKDFNGYQTLNITNDTGKDGYLFIRIVTGGVSYSINSIQIEQGTQATSYEPYKSNILTVNEDVTLRSNGSVYDELDLLTGKLTQRIDENGEVLSQEIVKTVDLTTLDQDGQPTKLKTFNDITHVEIKADNVIPSVDVEVATKISETLATLDPQQNDISNTQNKLGQTIDEQTENTDATMMATTEIYEQTL